MKEFTTIFVGLDVHKDSIVVAIAEGDRHGEVRHYGAIPGDLGALDRLIRKLRSRYAKLEFVYEAGPCGYVIYRHLKKKGLSCTVVAPSKTPKKSGDRIKNDRRDAMDLARLHRAGELTAVYVPDPDDEAMRDLTRARRCQECGTKGPAASACAVASSRPTICGPHPLGARPSALVGDGENGSSGPTGGVSGVRGRRGGKYAARRAVDRADPHPEPLVAHGPGDSSVSHTERGGFDRCRDGGGGSGRSDPVRQSEAADGVFGVGTIGAFQRGIDATGPDHEGR